VVLGRRVSTVSILLAVLLVWFERRCTGPRRTQPALV